MSEPIFLTIREAAAYLSDKVAPATLYRLHREGKFPAVRIGRHLMISRRLLDEWSAAQHEEVSA